MIDWQRQSDEAIEELRRNRDNPVMGYLLSWLVADREMLKEALSQCPMEDDALREKHQKALLLTDLLTALDAE